MIHVLPGQCSANTLFKEFDDELFSSRGLDGTVLHVFFALTQFFNAVVSKLDDLFLPHGQTIVDYDFSCFEHFGVMDLFDFQSRSSTKITTHYQNLFVDRFPHGAKHVLATKLFSNPNCDPRWLPGSYF